MSTHLKMLPFAYKCCCLLALIGVYTPSRAQYSQPVEASSEVSKVSKGGKHIGDAAIEAARLARAA